MEIDTSCGHCGAAMRIAVSSELETRVIEGGPEPLVFEPHVDWSTFAEPTIIDAY